MPKDTSLLGERAGWLQVEDSEEVEEEATIKAVRLLQKSQGRQLAAALLSLLSGGLFYLLTRWFSHLHILFTYSPALPHSSSPLYLEVTDQQARREVVSTLHKTLLFDPS